MHSYSVLLSCQQTQVYLHSMSSDGPPYKYVIKWGVSKLLHPTKLKWYDTFVKYRAHRMDHLIKTPSNGECKHFYTQLSSSFVKYRCTLSVTQMTTKQVLLHLISSDGPPDKNVLMHMKWNDILFLLFYALLFNLLQIYWLFLLKYFFKIADFHFKMQILAINIF